MSTANASLPAATSTPVSAEPAESPHPMDHTSTVGAVDVHYDESGRAKAALVVCRDLALSTVVSEYVVLGAHAADAFGMPVIGVAKTPFRTATHALQIIRGAATRPLYVTSAGGMDIAEAAQIVSAMAGPHRIPAALARVDRLARGREQPPAVRASPTNPRL